MDGPNADRGGREEREGRADEVCDTPCRSLASVLGGGGGGKESIVGGYEKGVQNIRESLGERGEDGGGERDIGSTGRESRGIIGRETGGSDGGNTDTDTCGDIGNPVGLDDGMWSLRWC